MQDLHHTARRSGRLPRRATSAFALLAIGAALALAGCDTFAGTAVTPTPIAAVPGAAGTSSTTASDAGAFAGAPGDWPMYGHDPARSGYNAGEIALDLSTVGQFGPRWQVGIGIGANPSSSAPSIADGRVFIGSSSTTGDNFFAFDATTGARLWSVRLGTSPTCFNVGIGATPAISGTTVVAGGSDGTYYGLDAATGAIRWTTALNAGPSGFAWASPLLAYGRAYLGVASGCDNPSVRGAVLAVDLQTGALLGEQAFVPEGQAGAGIWNSPALSPDGRTLAVTTGEDDGGYNGPYNRAMVALDPLTLAIGAADQEGPLDTDKDFATSPVIFSDADGRTLVAAHHKDDFFYAYDLHNLAAGPIWRRQTGSLIGLMPAYDPHTGPGGTLFLVDGLGRLLAVDPATGSDRWPPVAIGKPHGNLALANGLVLVNTGETGVLVVDGQRGEIDARLQPDGSGAAFSGLAIAHGFVYWASGPFLNAWSLPDAIAGPTAQGAGGAG